MGDEDGVADMCSPCSSGHTRLVRRRSVSKPTILCVREREFEYPRSGRNQGWMAPTKIITLSGTGNAKVALFPDGKAFYSPDGYN